MALITLAQAKAHLNETSTDRDVDIVLKKDQASAIILDYLKVSTTSTWTDLDVPGPVQAATLLVLGHLVEHRGDDLKMDADLWEAIGRLLCRFRDPALA